MLNSLFQTIARHRTMEVIGRIAPYIKGSEKVIDIGSGTGDIARILKLKGKHITPVDVADFHGPRLIKTTTYDGKTLPFPDKSFDTALLLMVLHHTPNPDTVFLEAARVAKEIVVIETSFTNPINKWLTVVADAIGNMRLEAFWNSYKSDQNWSKFFSKHGFKIRESHAYNDKNFFIIPFLHILYYLKKK